MTDARDEDPYSQPGYALVATLVPVAPQEKAYERVAQQPGGARTREEVTGSCVQWAGSGPRGARSSPNPLRGLTPIGAETRMDNPGPGPG